MKLTYTVTKKDSGKKLKDILKKRLYISAELLKKLKYSSSIYVNGKNEFVNYIVNEKDNILVDIDNYIKNKKDEKFEDKFTLKEGNLDILYEDEYLLIVNKPKDMPTHPSSNNYENTLSNIVASYLKKQGIYNIHIVTRLDKNTTGICIFAKNEYIQELFKRRKDSINLKKQYIAIVNGIVKEEHGVIEKNICRMENTIILRETTSNPSKGDYAKTEYNVLSRNYDNNYSVLSVILHTGRTHQIRVHMISIGHILLGDTLYAEHYNIKDIDKLIQRQALHAYKIEFNHPVTNKHIIITAPIPDDMKKLM